MKNQSTFKAGKEHKLYSHGHCSGGSLSKEYVAYQSMKTRCTNPKNVRYGQYGGRGIKVCDRWVESFENFIEDVGFAPSPDHSIDRINNDGDYEPTNVRWATDVQQVSRKTNSQLITYNGVTKNIASWAKEFGLGRATLAFRISSGWNIERALTEPAFFKPPPRNNSKPPINPHARLITFQNRTMRVSEWCKLTGLKRNCIEKRLRLGWSIEKTLTFNAPTFIAD